MMNDMIKYGIMKETITITPERMRREVSFEKAGGLSLDEINSKIKKKIELELKDKLINKYIELIFDENTFCKFREYSQMRIEVDKFLNSHFNIDIRYELIKVDRLCTMKKVSENEIEMFNNSFNELIKNEEWMFVKGTIKKFKDITYSEKVNKKDNLYLDDLCLDGLCLDEINKDIFYSVSRKYNNHFINLSYPKITTKSKYEPGCNKKLLESLDKKKLDYYSILKYPVRVIEMEEMIDNENI